MRITNSQTTALMQHAMNETSAKVGKALQQMATDKRLLLPSDDPIASVRVLRVQREEASLAQYRTNIANVSSSLSIQEANLKSASDTMLNVQDLLLWAANGSSAAEDLAAMAGELESLEKTILSFANVRDEEGRYVFSGTLSDVKTVNYDDATETYSVAGNDKYRQAAVANGVFVAENTTALEIFGADIAILNDIHSLVATLKDPALDAKDPAVLQQITATMNQLEETHGKLLGTITEIGGRQNTLTLLTNSNEEVSVVNQKIEGELSRLDYAGASIELNTHLLSLQSTQKTYLKINELSLFSLL